MPLSALHNATAKRGFLSLHISTYKALHFVPHSLKSLPLTHSLAFFDPDQHLAVLFGMCSAGFFFFFFAHWRSQLKHHLLLRASLETTTFFLSTPQSVAHVPFLINQTVNSTKTAAALLAGRYLLLSTKPSTPRILDIREGGRTCTGKEEKSFEFVGPHKALLVLTALRSQELKTVTTREQNYLQQTGMA